MNRREFVTLVGVGGAIASLSEVVTAATDGFVAVGTVQALDKTGQLLVKNASVGPVLVIKNPDGKGIRAVNPTCTHKGCTVDWKADQKSLVCPCHSASYSSTGQVIKGPAKKNLATYQTKISGNTILVKA
jgi:cytochrome b6-f complex iron-sulfur subunit